MWSQHNFIQNLSAMFEEDEEQILFTVFWPFCFTKSSCKLLRMLFCSVIILTAATKILILRDSSVKSLELGEVAFQQLSSEPFVMLNRSELTNLGAHSNHQHTFVNDS